jgi:hypothetical protein
VAVSVGAGSPAPRLHHPRRGRRQHRLASLLYGGTYNQFKVALKRLGIETSSSSEEDDPEAFGRRSTVAPRPSSWRRSPTPATTSPTSRPSPRPPTPRASRDRGQHVRCGGYLSDRSSTGPTSSRIRHEVDRRPWHLHRRRHRRLGQLRLAQRQVPASPTRRPGTTASVHRRLRSRERPSGTSPSPSGPGWRGCVTSGRRSPRSTPSSSSRGSRPCPPGPAPRRQRPRARSLARRPRPVEWVTYPGLESHPYHDLAKRYLTGTDVRGGAQLRGEGGLDAGGRSSTTSNWRRTSPTWATPRPS